MEEVQRMDERIEIKPMLSDIGMRVEEILTESFLEVEEELVENLIQTVAIETIRIIVLRYPQMLNFDKFGLKGLRVVLIY